MFHSRKKARWGAHATDILQECCFALLKRKLRAGEIHSREGCWLHKPHNLAVMVGTHRQLGMGTPICDSSNIYGKMGGRDRRQETGPEAGGQLT